MNQDAEFGFEELQEELQKEILAEARKLYTDIVIDHAMNPRNAGEMNDADGYGQALGSCGDDMEIWLRVKNGTISEAKFWTNGCSTTIASGSVITEMAKGRPVMEAQKISQQDVLRALDGLPEEHQHCATLAANAMKGAVKDYIALKREPWKRNYQRR